MPVNVPVVCCFRSVLYFGTTAANDNDCLIAEI